MKTTHDITRELGSRNMASALGVTTNAISKFTLSGEFPAGWWIVISKLCAENGKECPVSVFNFKSPVSAPSSEDASHAG